MAKYSIILPVRNGGEYIKACAASILSQTLNDFNLVILENCSTDGTKEWLESLKDQRILVVPSERPLTMEENWGRILSTQRNEFMTMLGADDILHPDYLAVIDALIKKHPAASLYQAHFHFIDPAGKVIGNCKPVKESENAFEFLESIFFNRSSIMGTGFMMRSQDYDVVGGIPGYSSLLFADFELLLELTRLSYKATAAEFAFSYRIHPQSTTSNSSFIKYAAGLGQLITYFKNLMREDKGIEQFIKTNGHYFIDFNCRGSAHKLLRTPINKRDGISVADIIDRYKIFAQELMPGEKYNPTDNFSIKLAKLIDSNPVTRGLFLLFKKVYSKPIYT